MFSYWSSLLLESERWRQSDIPTEVQALVHRLESGAGLQLPQATPTAISSQPPAKYLVIHGANFAVLRCGRGLWEGVSGCDGVVRC